MRYLSLILITLMLASCATSQAKYNSDVVDYRIEQSMRGYSDGGGAARVANPIPMPPTPPPAIQSVTGWDVLGAIVAIPLLVPIAMITSYPSYRGVHCRSYVYKDEYNTKCY